MLNSKKLLLPGQEYGTNSSSTGKINLENIYMILLMAKFRHNSYIY